MRLEAWAAGHLAGVADQGQRRLLRSYARWRVLRRARQRSETAGAARTPTRYAKVCLSCATAFLAFLAARQRDLDSCTQGDVDDWLAEGPPSASLARDFLEWAGDRKLTGRFVVPGQPRRGGPAADDAERWATARRLLHDEGLELGDRVAGTLVLVYGQQLSRIVALTRDQVEVSSGGTRLHLGTTPIDVPPPLDDLLARLVRERRPYSGVGSPALSTWLFPGLGPRTPLSAYQLGQRLRRLGIEPAPARRLPRSATSRLACPPPWSPRCWGSARSRRSQCAGPAASEQTGPRTLPSSPAPMPSPPTESAAAAPPTTAGPPGGRWWQGKAQRPMPNRPSSQAHRDRSRARRARSHRLFSADCLILPVHPHPSSAPPRP